MCIVTNTILAFSYAFSLCVSTEYSLTDTYTRLFNRCFDYSVARFFRSAVYGKSAFALLITAVDRIDEMKRSEKEHTHTLIKIDKTKRKKENREEVEEKWNKSLTQSVSQIEMLNSIRSRFFFRSPFTQHPHTHESIFRMALVCRLK